jgi:hypothetical protein
MNCETMFRKLVDPQVRDTLITDILHLSDSNTEEYEDHLRMEESRVSEELREGKLSGPIPAPLKACIKATYGNHQKAVLLSHLTINVITYSTSSQHLGNSSILLKSGVVGKLLPAQIDYLTQIVFEDEGNQPQHMVTFIAACKYKAASILYDLFKLYPDVQAQIWRNKLGPLGLYPINSIDCHFAHLPLSIDNQEMIAIISLSRVSSSEYPVI